VWQAAGSGKSTFSEGIRAAFPDEVMLLSCDNYYKAHDDISLEAHNELNYDMPEAIDFSLMTQQVAALKEGQSVQCPIYDFSLHIRTSRSVTIEPMPILVLDGILLYTNPQLRDLIDLKNFVETHADERILRRTRRDVVERGRTMGSVIAQYLQTVKPMHYQYVEPMKSYADMIIYGGMNEKALDLVENKIRSILLKK
jgi:uridine kinase